MQSAVVAAAVVEDKSEVDADENEDAKGLPSSPQPQTFEEEYEELVHIESEVEGVVKALVVTYEDQSKIVSSGQETLLSSGSEDQSEGGNTSPLNCLGLEEIIAADDQSGAVSSGNSSPLTVASEDKSDVTLSGQVSPLNPELEEVVAAEAQSEVDADKSKDAGKTETSVTFTGSIKKVGTYFVDNFLSGQQK